MWSGESAERWPWWWWNDLEWESWVDCLLVWEHLLELTESALASLLLCCLCFSVLLSTLLDLTEAFPGLLGLWASVTPRVVSLIGLSTCRVISLRKAENFVFSFIKSLLASLFLPSGSFPCHSLSLGLVRASIDLALRKPPPFPEPLVILCVFLRVPWVEDLLFSRFCLAGSLFW